MKTMPEHSTKRTNPLLILLISAVIGILTFVIHFIIMTKSQFANGWDGYYYLVQLKSLVETGKLHSNDISLIYPFLYALKLFIPDAVLCYKISSSTISALFVIGLFILSFRLSDNLFKALLISLFSMATSSLIFVSSNFPKSLFALCFLIGFFIALTFRFSWKNLSFQILFGIGCLITHRLTAGLLFIFLFIYLFNKRYFKLLAVTIGIGGVFIFILSIFLPGTLHLSDLSRLSNAVSIVPQIGPHSFASSLGYQSLSLSFKIELFLVYIMALVSLAVFFIKRRGYPNSILYLSIFILLILLIIPFYQISTESMGYRLFLTFLLLAPLSILALLHALNQKVIALISIIFCILIGQLPFVYDPKAFDPPYLFYDSLIQQIKSHDQYSNMRLIIMHKAFAELYTFQTDRDALSWIPEYPIEREKLYRISADIPLVSYQHYLDGTESSTIMALGFNYNLIREDYYQKFVDTIVKNKDDSLLEHIHSWKNPVSKRPAYLLRNKKQ